MTGNLTKMLRYQRKCILHKEKKRIIYLPQLIAINCSLLSHTLPCSSWCSLNVQLRSDCLFSASSMSSATTPAPVTGHWHMHTHTHMCTHTYTHTLVSYRLHIYKSLVTSTCVIFVIFVIFCTVKATSPEHSHWKKVIHFSVYCSR